MYKIMIVDDEILVRVGLKSTIDWPSIGFEIVAEASNGEQAFEMFQHCEPDVILTDIKMPKMDGIKLTELVKQHNPEVKVVILTCYDEFSYAREALKLGASNYILKSEIEDEELIHLMRDIQKELDAEIGKLERYSLLQRQINSNINVLKEKLLSDLIESKIKTDKDFFMKCDSLKLNVEGKSFNLAVFYKDNMENFTNYSDRDLQLLDSGVINIINELLSEKGLNFLIGSRRDSFVLLVIHENPVSAEVEAVINRIRDSVLKYLNISLTTVMSRNFSEISSTGSIFKDCEKRSQIMFYKGRGNIITAGSPNLKEVNIIEYAENYTKPLISCMDDENLRNAEEIILNLEKSFTDANVSPFQVKLYYIGLVNDVLEHYNGCIPDENELNDYSNYSNLFLSANRISEITRLLKIFIEGIIRSVKRNRMDNSKSIIYKAVSYITKNYNEKISLESIAAHVNLSKQYLSYIFKRETGENVSVYINRIRVEKAKELIKKYDYRVKELFDKVGFSDQQYFCKTFKRVTGMTIAEYKEEITKKVQA